MGRRFFDIHLDRMVEEETPRRALPGSGSGPQIYFKYVPRTNPKVGAGADVAYATTGAPRGADGLQAQNISFDDFEFRRWTARGELAWHEATFEQLPLIFPIVNALAGLGIEEYVDAEMVSFSGPGIAVSTNVMRPIEPQKLDGDEHPERLPPLPDLSALGRVDFDRPRGRLHLGEEAGAEVVHRARLAWTQMLSAATRDSASTIGTAAERRPSSSSWSTIAKPCARTRSISSRSAFLVVSVCGVSLRGVIRFRRDSSSSGGREASRTRPIEVA